MEEQHYGYHEKTCISDPHFGLGNLKEKVKLNFFLFLLQMFVFTLLVYKNDKQSVQCQSHLIKKRNKMSPM